MRFPALLTLPVLVLLLVAAFAPASVFAARAAAAAFAAPAAAVAFAAPAAAVAFAAPAAAVASADAQRDDAHVGADAVPASILPRIHALERAFGIGEAARRRASASANSTLATLPTLVGQQIDPATGAAVCSSQTCTSCGDLIVGSVGQNIPLVAAAPDSAGTDYYGFQICNTSPSLQFSFGSFSAVCSAANTVFCQYHVADGLTYSIAYATNTPVWTYTNNAVGYYQEGSNDCIPGGVPRAMQITFTCGAGADMITNVIPPANPTLSYCTWQVFISTPLVCGVSSATLNPDANGSSNGESGSGWIIFAVVLAVVIALELACMARRSL